MRRTAFSPHERVYIDHVCNKGKYDMNVQHYHNTYEIYLQVMGKRYLFHDNICHMLERGSLVIFAPFDIHYAQSREANNYERYVLNFRESDLDDILTAEERFMLLDKLKAGVIKLSEEQTKETITFFESMIKYDIQKGFLSDKLLACEIVQFLAYMSGWIVSEYGDGGHSVPEYVMTALKFINAHYREPITLDDIVDAVHVSKFYFCRMFREVTGATVMDYLTNMRLTKVHNMLLNTNMKIDEIAEKNGFAAATALTRSFKKIYGMSPRDFRKQSK